VTRRLETVGAEQTEAAGAELAATLAPGDVVLIEGELGAGKTTFVRGACRELGVTDPVTSPTFTIGQRYAGRVPVSHLDLYRLAAAGAAGDAAAGDAAAGDAAAGDAAAGEIPGEDPALLADYLGPDTIAFIEWPQVGERALRSHAKIVRRVRLSHAGGDRRSVEIE
jgi:tRNA threonylcarbamoyladenosine biosynthesis protein TsaE